MVNQESVIDELAVIVDAIQSIYPVDEIAIHRLVWHPTKRYSVREKGDITTLVIHHSATQNATVESIARWHVRHNGWPGIGYHFVVAQDGRIMQVNRLETVSYHVGNANGYSVGICLPGNFMTTFPAEPQLASTKRLLSWLLRHLDLPPESIKGHRDLMDTTECPGNTWPLWREKIIP